MSAIKNLAPALSRNLESLLDWLEAPLKEAANRLAPSALFCAAFAYLLSPVVQFAAFLREPLLLGSHPGDFALLFGLFFLGAVLGAVELLRLTWGLSRNGEGLATRLNERRPAVSWAISGVLTWLTAKISPMVAEALQQLGVPLALLVVGAAIVLKLGLPQVERACPPTNRASETALD